MTQDHSLLGLRAEALSPSATLASGPATPSCSPGPWEAKPNDGEEGYGASDEVPYLIYSPEWVIATVVADVEDLTDEAPANARLIAAAPDHALIAAALCSGAARWDRFEFCIGGLRHSTTLDEFGVPVMTAGMRAALAEGK